MNKWRRLGLVLGILVYMVLAVTILPRFIESASESAGLVPNVNASIGSGSELPVGESVSPSSEAVESSPSVATVQVEGEPLSVVGPLLQKSGAEGERIISGERHAREQYLVMVERDTDDPNLVMRSETNLSVNYDGSLVETVQEAGKPERVTVVCDRNHSCWSSDDAGGYVKWLPESGYYSRVRDKFVLWYDASRGAVMPFLPDGVGSHARGRLAKVRTDSPAGGVGDFYSLSYSMMDDAGKLVESRAQWQFNRNGGGYDSFYVFPSGGEGEKGFVASVNYSGVDEPVQVTIPDDSLVHEVKGAESQ